MNPAIVVMAKEPRPGAAKTRLCPPLTHAQAADLYAACIQDVVDNARAVPMADVVLAVSPPEATAAFERLVPGLPLLPVTGPSIGRCLDVALTDRLAHGHPSAVAISSDSPDLWSEIIARGVEALREADVVLGPAQDGGYFLVGLRRPAPALFADDIPWSTPDVLRQTLERATRLGLAVRLLTDSVTDVDTAADLEALQRALVGQPASRARHVRAALVSLEFT